MFVLLLVVATVQTIITLGNAGRKMCLSTHLLVSKYTKTTKSNSTQDSGIFQNNVYYCILTNHYILHH